MHDSEPRTATFATLTGDSAGLDMEMTVQYGKGYSLAENNKDEEAPIGTIPIDAVYSPIRRVVYVVGNARVGQTHRLR